MSEYIDEWHSLVVTAVPAEDGLSADLDFDIEHPTACPTVDNAFEPYACGMANELGFAGFDNFGITEPGTYRARFCAWEIPSNPINGGPEVDTCVEVERLDDAEEATDA